MSPIVEAMRWMRATPEAWHRTTVDGVWYLDVGDRAVMVYGAPGRWWWHGPAGRGRCCRSLRRAMLEGQRAALAWVLGGGWKVRRAKRLGRITAASFMPTKADHAAAAKLAPAAPPDGEPAEIEDVVAA